ncbi:MAG: methyltransferase domain-containing protein [Verrucomicrobiota bacterium]|nr:methyltransferase domain-containing protein [Verrucomicrobiota bacterium]
MSVFTRKDPDAIRAEREEARRLAHERGETSAVRLPDEGLSTDKILRATVAKIRQLAPDLRGDYLDVGAGNGELIDRVVREFPVKARACDYRDDLITLGDVQVDVANLNTDALPYPDASFDLVTCTEVIEHLEHFRAPLREIARVLRPGGIFVVSTPNVLNLRSRLRYLLFGFFNMFGPLQLGDDRHHSTHGHINPVSYFYLAHALVNAGFTELSVSVDKHQRGSWLSMALLWLPLKIYSARAIKKERDKYHTLDSANEPFVLAMNTTDLLLGRTILVGCTKSG